MTIYIFGNPLSDIDSLPVKLLPKLKKDFPTIKFIHADPTDNWWQSEKEIVIIDTVVGINKVTIFNDMESFQKQSMISPHDYDLYTDLALMTKAGKIDSVRIIGVPIDGTITDVNNIIVPIINRLLVA